MMELFPPQLKLTVQPEKREFYNLILQSGSIFTVPANTTIGVFLRDWAGFSEEYIVNVVQTIFLNGSATDDLLSPLPAPTSTLALSAAMPGLAGAIFRKDGFHSALRSSTMVESESNEATETIVTLKLFNAIARDQGEILLTRGITVQAENLKGFFESRSTLLEAITGITFRQKKRTLAELTAILRENQTIQLTLTT